MQMAMLLMRLPDGLLRARQFVCLLKGVEPANRGAAFAACLPPFATERSGMSSTGS
jgi:hypothetical protein